VGILLGAKEGQDDGDHHYHHHHQPDHLKGKGSRLRSLLFFFFFFFFCVDHQSQNKNKKTTPSSLSSFSGLPWQHPRPKQNQTSKIATIAPVLACFEYSRGQLLWPRASPAGMDL
jgi:hypothetical protein